MTAVATPLDAAATTPDIVTNDPHRSGGPTGVF